MFQRTTVHVIHAVGPDLRVGNPSDADALSALTAAYRNILAQFDASSQPVLRLLPVSGGIFAGEGEGCE
jgi:O-acetyl-ADP-ribose deacetylase (regulator of RNase III)